MARGESTQAVFPCPFSADEIPITAMRQLPIFHRGVQLLSGFTDSDEYGPIFNHLTLSVGAAPHPIN
jgi:hypothetical protein